MYAELPQGIPLLPHGSTEEEITMTPIRKTITSLFLAGVAGMLITCMSVPENRLPLYQRSVVVTDEAAEYRILEKASLTETRDPALNNIKVLHLSGTPYEMGFQHGRLIREDVQANLSHIMRRVKFYASEDMMDEVYDLMAPYIPLEEQEEMRGLAHGADMPLRLIHWVHAIPEVSEYGPKKRFRTRFRQTSCSNVVAFGKSTADGSLYQLRVLDWMRELGAQRYPVVLVHRPERGNASVTFSYAGFIGCVSGMNEKKLAFGEMGYGNPPGESLEGIPFVFLFRKLMREADTLAQARQMILEARRTCSYAYMISDVKSRNDAARALLFITDRQKVRTSGENTPLVDERDGDTYPAIDDVVYGGAEAEKLSELLSEYHGRISPEVLMKITGPVSLKGNMQNVIFRPDTLETWVSNAANATRDRQGKAAYQKWFYFDFGKALGR